MHRPSNDRIVPASTNTSANTGAIVPWRDHRANDHRETPRASS